MPDQKKFVANSVSLASGTPGRGSVEFLPSAQANDGVVISCYDSEVPSFVEPELQRLSGHICCSLRYLTMYGKVPAHTSTYIVRKNHQIVTIFLFRREGSRVRVLNEHMMIGEEDLARFAGHIFSAYASVNVIEFYAVPTDIRRLPFPYQCFAWTENIVAALPATREAYLASLGKSTRSYLQRYEKKLRRTFPSFCVKVYQNEEVNPDDIRAIVQMNRARMAAKAKVSSNTDEETERVITLVRECGVVCVATIDGRICAGVINYRLGSTFFMPVIAHDPQYNEYRLGTINCFLTICECIALGCREYHFLWGRYEYKYRLGGVMRDLDILMVYRSRMQFLLNGRTALKIAAAGRWRIVREWMLEQGTQHGRGGLTSRVVYNLVDGLRKIKRRHAR
jgi:hypothetical protein